MPLDGNAAAQFENVDRLVIFSQNCQQPTVWRNGCEAAIGGETQPATSAQIRQVTSG